VIPPFTFTYRKMPWQRDGVGITRSARCCSRSRSFVVGKEKQPILLHRPAHRHAENIAVQLQRFVRVADIQLRLLDQVVISAGDGVAQVFIDRAVKGIGTAFVTSATCAPEPCPWSAP